VQVLDEAGDRPLVEAGVVQVDPDAPVAVAGGGRDEPFLSVRHLEQRILVVAVGCQSFDV